MTNDEVLLVLRDAFERAEACDPEQEAKPLDVDAFLAALGTFIEKQHGAKAYEARMPGKPPRTIDTFTPEVGGWRVVNLSTKFFGATLDAETRAAFPPGESFLPADFSGTFPPDHRGKPQAIESAIESGEIVLLAPGSPDTTAWREKLTAQAWTRRAQSCVSADRAEELRECLARMPRGPVRENFEHMLARLEADRAKAAE
jgi:hypothetical protein